MRVCAKANQTHLTKKKKKILRMEKQEHSFKQANKTAKDIDMHPKQKTKPMAGHKKEKDGQKQKD